MNNKLPLDTRMLQQQAQSTSVDRENSLCFLGILMEFIIFFIITLYEELSCCFELSWLFIFPIAIHI